MDLFNIEAEEGTISSVLYNPEAYLDAADIVDPVDFKTERFGWCWEAFRNLYSKGTPIDSITVANEMNSRFDEFQRNGGHAHQSRVDVGGG